MSQQGQGGTFRTQAQELITYLTATGMSYADIGRAIGRDGSYIRQAAVPNAKGYLKPATPAIPALRSLVESGGKAEVFVPRRTTKEGELANVRGGFSVEKEGGRYSQSKSPEYMLKEIQIAAEKRQWLQLRVRYDEVKWRHGDVVEKHATIELYRKGYGAEALLQRIQERAKEKGISEENALAEILREDSFSATAKQGGSPGMSDAGKVEQYSMDASDAAPWRQAV